MANKPYLVVEWNDTETDAKGWMCAYNFVNHYCGGGKMCIRDRLGAE